MFANINLIYDFNISIQLNNSSIMNYVNLIIHLNDELDETVILSIKNMKNINKQKNGTFVKVESSSKLFFIYKLDNVDKILNNIKGINDQMFKLLKKQWPKDAIIVNIFKIKSFNS